MFPFTVVPAYIEDERCDAVQVLTFHTKAWSSFAPTTCRMPPGPYQASPELITHASLPCGLTKTGIDFAAGVLLFRS